MAKVVRTKDIPGWKNRIREETAARKEKKQPSTKSFSNMSRAEKDDLLKELLMRFRIVTEE